MAVGDKAPEEVHAVVEIPAKSKVKYELDKDTGADYIIHMYYLYACVDASFIQHFCREYHGVCHWSSTCSWNDASNCRTAPLYT